MESTLDGVLLWQNACEFIAASRKLAPQGFTRTEAWQTLKGFAEILPLVPPTPQVLIHAERLMAAHSISVWDALVLGACEDCGASRLFSEDLTHGQQYGNVLVVNPFRSPQES